jgi:chitinase
MITKAGVPSNKVVVGVTSYARSFKMTTPGCHGEMCTFTGPDSGALPGPCTDTAGYISDAEINQILASDRVNHNFIDGKSQSNVLVCKSNSPTITPSSPQRQRRFTNRITPFSNR